MIMSNGIEMPPNTKTQEQYTTQNTKITSHLQYNTNKQEVLMLKTKIKTDIINKKAAAYKLNTKNNLDSMSRHKETNKDQGTLYHHPI